MTVLFVYELNVLHVSIYYMMKEEVFQDILFMKRMKKVGLYVIYVFYLRCHVV